MQGDIIAVYGNDGTKHISYTYDAWGNFTITKHTTVGTDAEKNPFTYRGYFYSYELGMYYLGTRWYDPVIGRFISPDRYVSTGQGILGHNMYAYCGNNPVNFVDPSGEFAIGIIVGGIVGAVGGIISASISGTSLTAGAISGAFTGATIGAIGEAFAASAATAGAATPAYAAIAIAFSGVAGALGNYINQSINYNECIRNSTIDMNTTLEDYVDTKSILISGISGAISGAAGIGIGSVVSTAFTEGALYGVDKLAKGIADAWLGGTTTLLFIGIDTAVQGVMIAWSE